MTFQIGENVGPYQIIERIGEGGFAEVWLAQQEEPVPARTPAHVMSYRGAPWLDRPDREQTEQRHHPLPKRNSAQLGRHGRQATHRAGY